MKTVRITADNGAAVNVVLDYVDAEEADAIAVALECINANPTFDKPGDIFYDYKLSVLVEKHAESVGNFDRVTDGASSGYMIEIAGYSVLWHSGISDDHCLTIAPAGTSIEDWVRSWDDNGREYAESWGFGWDDGSAEVDEDFEGEVAIQVIPHFYAGTLGRKTNPHLLTNDVGNVIIFDDFQAAKAWIDEQDESVYVLAHGEYARPDYQIMDAGII